MHIIINTTGKGQQSIIVENVYRFAIMAGGVAIRQGDQIILIEGKKHALELVEALRAMVGDWDE